jgi:hypothetical protein
MAIRKIISRSIGVDVIAAEDIAANAISTAEIQNGAVTAAKLDSGISFGGGAYQGENNSGAVSGSTGDIFRVHEQQLDTDVTIASTDNALAAGPLTIASTATLTVSGNLTIV